MLQGDSGEGIKGQFIKQKTKKPKTKGRRRSHPHHNFVDQCGRQKLFPTRSDNALEGSYAKTVKKKPAERSGGSKTKKISMKNFGKTGKFMKHEREKLENL